MAKLIKIVIQVFLMAIIFIPNYSTAQVNYTAKKDRHAESIDRQEERRIEKNRAQEVAEASDCTRECTTFEGCT